MSETCHPGIAYILQLYTEEQSRVDTALTHNVCHTSKEDGMRGMELASTAEEAINLLYTTPVWNKEIRKFAAI